MIVKLPIPKIITKTYIYEASQSTVINSIPDAKLWFALNGLFQYEESENIEVRTYNWQTDIAYKFKIPFIKRKQIESFEYECIIKNPETLISYIEGVLGSGKYLYSHFEQYYIPGLAPYNKYKFSHDFLAYGFDSEKRELYILTYTKNKRFESLSVNYDNLYQAFKENTDCRMFLECEPCDHYYVPTLHELYSSLLKYRYLISNIDNKNFNIETYNSLIKFMSNICSENIDFRPFRFFYERKKLLLYLIQYIQATYLDIDINQEIKQFETVSYKTQLTFNLLIKYSLKQTTDAKFKMINILKDAYSIEKNALDSVLNKINILLGYIHDA